MAGSSKKFRSFVQMDLWQDESSENLSSLALSNPLLGSESLVQTACQGQETESNRFQKMVLVDDHQQEDAILFINHSTDGSYHLIFFEKISQERSNPRRLEIILSQDLHHLKRVGNHSHWEINPDNKLKTDDQEEWLAIIAKSIAQSQSENLRVTLGQIQSLLATNSLFSPLFS